MDDAASECEPAAMRTRPNWLVVLICGSAILSISMGVRQVSGFFLRPVVMELGLTREAFGFAVGLQNLVWGLTQPIAGYLSDRYGAGPVALGCGLVYAAGMALAALAGSGAAFTIGFGVLAGLGQAGTAFAVVFAAIGRIAPESARSTALGIGSAAGSLGMFALVPITTALIGTIDWRPTLWGLAALIGAIPLLALALGRGDVAATSAPAGAAGASAALRAVARDRDFWLLNLGFAVCGFQLAFVAAYIPTILVDAGMTAALGAGVLAAIGVFNIAGSYLAGAAGAQRPKTHVLIVIYLARAATILAFLWLPLSPVSALLFGAAMGLLWTGTVPLTSALVGDLWGRRHLGLLFALVYIGHQFGAFAGAWAGGFGFDRTGSFLPVWLLCVAFSLIAALCHFLVLERPRPIALAEAARA